MMLYCPKCQKTYEEGKLRFCNNDGERLVPAAAVSGNSAGQPQGVFTSILGIPTPIGKNDEEEFESVPKFIKPNGDGGQVESANPADFFKLKPQSQDEEKQPRVIKPLEIPSGQAFLGDRKINPTGREALTWDNPRALIGQQIKNRYKILEISEQSESGISFLAKDRINDGKKVLITVLMNETGDADGRIFAEERKSLSLLNHPNVERILDSGELLEGKPFVVREYFEGVSVADMLEKSGQFNHLRAAAIVRQTAYAIDAIHQIGAMHRRLKPENIILTVAENGSEQVKLVNTGLFDEEINRNNLPYISPEQLSDKAENFSEDVYALAVIAFQMLTNRLPFDANSAKSLLQAQHEKLAFYPTNLRLDVPSAVDEILEKALAANPAERYPKAIDFGNAFYNALTGVALGEKKEKPQIPIIKQKAAAREEVSQIRVSEEDNREEFSKIPANEIGNFSPDKSADKTVKNEIAQDADLAEIPMPRIELPGKTKFTKQKISEPEIAKEISPIEKPETEIFENDIRKINVETISLDKFSEKDVSDENIVETADGKIISDKKDAAWKKRSPEKPKNSDLRSNILPFAALILSIAALFIFWFYVINRPDVPQVQTTATSADQTKPNQQAVLPNEIDGYSPNNEDIEIPPPKRQVSQPPDTKYFENSKQNLKGGMARNFLGFSLFYPKDWNLNPTDNKFLDLTKTSKGSVPEKVFLVSPYESRGTFRLDQELFPDLVEKSNADLAKDIPNYQVISKGKTMIQNGRWQAFEVKFQGGGAAPEAGGKKLILWGRRLWIPVQRPGMKNGFIITMFATSLAGDVTSVDDVGVKGDLAKILETFEPSQSY